MTGVLATPGCPLAGSLCLASREGEYQGASAQPCLLSQGGRGLLLTLGGWGAPGRPRLHVRGHTPVLRELIRNMGVGAGRSGVGVGSPAGDCWERGGAGPGCFLTSASEESWGADLPGVARPVPCRVRLRMGWSDPPWSPSQPHPRPPCWHAEARGPLDRALMPGRSRGGAVVWVEARGAAWGSGARRAGRPQAVSGSPVWTAASSWGARSTEPTWSAQPGPGASGEGGRPETAPDPTTSSRKPSGVSFSFRPCRAQHGDAQPDLRVFSPENPGQGRARGSAHRGGGHSGSTRCAD